MSEPREILTRTVDLGVIEAYGDHPDQVREWFAPAGTPRATVAFIHGGFWRPEYDRAHTRPACHDLAQRGFRVVTVEYRRGTGDPWDTGGDVVAALADLTSPILVGHSAGGNLALYAEARDTVTGTLALAPITDVFDCFARHLDGDAAEAFCGGGPDDALVAYEAFTAAEPHHPVTVLHGDVDTNVPIDMSRRYAAHTAAQLRELPGIEHFGLINPESNAWSQVVEAIEELL